MDKQFVYNSLCSIIGGDKVACDVPMSKHCTFKTGGDAKVFASPCSVEELVATVKFARSNGIEYFVIGNGSNLLVDDNGFDGLIVHIGKNMSDIAVDGNRITAMAGASMAKLSIVALEHGLQGLEFAAGIPGTVGGGVYMNAGAYDGEIKQVAVSTTYVDDDGNIGVINGEEHCFGYRCSVFANGGIVAQTVFELTPGNKDEISAKMADYNQRRRSKQPLNMPNAGSTFKRPEGYFAGKLIEDCGLRGYSIGGAQVSEKHCGFVVNTGNATTDDILALIDHIQSTVYQKFGVVLETEVKYLGGK